MTLEKFSTALTAALMLMFVAPVIAADNTATARLSGYQETPVAFNSPGSGEFKVRISPDESSIDYELQYRDLSVLAPTQAHIHFGRPGLGGGVAFFLCTNLTPLPSGVPAPQACPNGPATITGTLTAADVIAISGQGIAAGTTGFAAMVKAIREGATYANVHTTTVPSGEIRGAINDHRGEH